MCFKASADKNDPGALQNEAIEKQLREDKKRLQREIKILLLGAGESGKSTILKQMKMIYANGFNDQDRKQFKVTIFSNLVNAFHTILQAMEELEEPFEKPANNKYVEWITSEPEIDTSQPFPREFEEAFRNLWLDSGVQRAISRGNEYALHDNLS
ncbi:MAG: hypothetical protein Q9162_007314 [Coniocarpon cinnabarinum]